MSLTESKLPSLKDKHEAQAEELKVEIVEEKVVEKPKKDKKVEKK